MGFETAIEWTQSTWNPWTGCKKVSPGCANCYMYRDKKQFGGNPEVIARSKTRFDLPLRWKEPRLIFTCSWSDWFIEEADAWRKEAWDIIRKTPQHTYQILTKRPERIIDNLPDDWGDGYGNVWLGITVENQKMAEKRIPVLKQVPAKIRFLSCEPLLGMLDLLEKGLLEGIHWVIAGGESGNNVRPMHPHWLRSLRDQCIEANIPFFFKQWGAWCPKSLNVKGSEFYIALDGSKHMDASNDQTEKQLESMIYVGMSTKAPAILDGETWKQMPLEV